MMTTCSNTPVLEIPSLKLTVRIGKCMVKEDDPFLLGFGLFSGAFAVSLREGI